MSQQYYPNLTLEIDGNFIPISSITRLQPMGDRIRVHFMNVFGADSFDFYMSREKIEEKVYEYHRGVADLESYRATIQAYGRASK